MDFDLLAQVIQKMELLFLIVLLDLRIFFIVSFEIPDLLENGFNSSFFVD